MARKKLTETTEATSEAQSTGNFTHVAISVFKDPATKKWTLAEIAFDPKTRETKFLPTRVTAELKDIIHEKFKIAAIKLGIMG